MVHLVAISDKHKAHIIHAEDGVNLTGVPAVCGFTSDRWRLYMNGPGEDAKPELCT